MSSQPQWPSPGQQPPPVFTEKEWREAAGCAFYLIPIVGLILVALHLGSYPTSNWPRTLATLGLLIAGIGTALVMQTKNELHRLLAAGLGIGLAVAAWLFVPTDRGLCWWSARAGFEELHVTLVTDRELYAQRLQACREAAKQFPEFREQLTDAEKLWKAARATADVEEARRLVKEDPVRARDLLREVNAASKTGDSAGREWRSVGDLRWQAFDAAVESARQELGKLLAEKKQAELFPLIRKMQSQWGREAGELGPEAEGKLTAFALDAARARLGELEQEVKALVSAGKLDEADRLIGATREEWAPELKQLGLKGAFQQLRGVVVAGRLDAANRALDELITAKKLSELPAFCKQVEGLRGEVKDAGQEGSLSVDGIIKRAVGARLEAARVEFQKLLAEDRYADIAALVMELRKEWSKEFVENHTEMRQFCSQCEVLLEVARTAGKYRP